MDDCFFAGFEDELLKLAGPGDTVPGMTKKDVDASNLRNRTMKPGAALGFTMKNRTAVTAPKPRAVKPKIKPVKPVDPELDSLLKGI